MLWEGEFRLFDFGMPVFVNGQVVVPAGGQLKVPTPRVG